jgi:hypothetical protein
MRKKKKEDNSYLKILIAFIIFIISIVMFMKTTNIVENVIVSYNTNSNINYKVYILENDYIKSEYMEKGKTYITSLVDKITVNFNYQLNSSNKLDSNYKYDIIAKIVVKHNSTGKELWSEEIKLADNKDATEKDKTNLSITDSIDVPYQEYNTKVKNFKSQFNIPITAYVDINLVVKDALNNNQKVATTGISMDLNEDTFEIDEVSTGNQVENITEEVNPNKTLIIAEVTVAIISAIYIIIKVCVLVNTSSLKKSYYSKAIYKILKNYGDIVAELVKPVDLSGLKVIDVKNFDQMLDVEEELRIPIMFYETVKNEEGHFVLVHQDMAYRYILKDKFRN